MVQNDGDEIMLERVAIDLKDQLFCIQFHLHSYHNSEIELLFATTAKGSLYRG